ncbi:MAG: class I SAM-dependent methyltransferase [Planctomycetota bacterium]
MSSAVNPAAEFAPETARRAAASQGASADAIYQMVRGVIVSRHAGGGLLADVGCGHGHLWQSVTEHFDRYAGIDAVRYDGFPDDGEFVLLDLDTGGAPLPDGAADVVACVETIEHVENPRALARELMRLAKPGGLVIVTTPNQLSLLSKLTLVIKNQFNAFTESSYPAHLTALLECDLRRIAAECGLEEVEVLFTGQGRVPGTKWHWPSWLSAVLPRAFSDNVGLVGRKRQSR